MQNTQYFFFYYLTSYVKFSKKCFSLLIDLFIFLFYNVFVHIFIAQLVEHRLGKAEVTGSILPCKLKSLVFVIYTIKKEKTYMT